MISIAVTNLTQLIKKIAEDARKAAKPCNIVIGTVLKVKPLMVALNGRTDVRFVRRLVRNERYNNLPIFQFIRMSYEK